MSERRHRKPTDDVELSTSQTNSLHYYATPIANSHSTKQVFRLKFGSKKKDTSSMTLQNIYKHSLGTYQSSVTIECIVIGLACLRISFQFAYVEFLSFTENDLIISTDVHSRLKPVPTLLQSSSIMFPDWLYPTI